ncbi:MAG: hypothetical protein LBJ17_04150 [Dysgonamonadaceae bacterium]|jgi:hypothetical protein|nr:hypothetical protein [Dysgonamonadaceae bacterium]
MNNSDYIPQPDGKFLQWTNNFINYLSGLYTQLGFPREVYEQLTTLHGDFAQKLEIAEEPATRTKLSVQAKNDARAALEKDLRQAIREYLTNNHLVTDEDRDGLGLPIHKITRTPSPVATDSPDTDVDTSVIGRITINFFEKGSRHKKGKPAGQHGAEVAWIISDTPPTRWDELLHSNIDTNSPFTLSFEHDQRGKTVYFALRWENTRGEKGPWSEIASAIIP